MARLNILHEELRRRVCEHFDADSLCELLDITSEDIFDALWDYDKHIGKVEDVLTELDYDSDG